MRRGINTIVSSTIVGLATFGLAILGCDKWTAYSGDGIFSDNGSPAPDWQYELDLGQIEELESRFRISGLPSEEFRLGFEIEGFEWDSHCTPPPSMPLAWLQLEASDGEVLIDVNGSLSSEWGSGQHLMPGCKNYFIHKQGEWETAEYEDGEFHVIKIGPAPHKVWGGSFTPQLGAEYIVQLKMSWIDDLGYQLRLTAMG